MEPIDTSPAIPDSNPELTAATNMIKQQADQLRMLESELIRIRKLADELSLALARVTVKNNS